MNEQDNKLLIRIAVASLLPVGLLGCSDEMHVFRPDDGASGLRFELRASIDPTSDTRADDSGFADGDRFGLFVVNYNDGTPTEMTLSGNQVNNVAMTLSADANTWQSATDIYWRDPVTPADVYGYYPFNNGLSSVDAFSFEVRADQSVRADGEMGGYEASDFLWAKTPKATPGKKVEMKFGHIMAGVKVVLEQGSGFDSDAWIKLDKTVTVDNTVRTSEIDLRTGTVSPTGSCDRNIVMNQEVDAWRAVVVPQTVAAGKSTIGINIDGKSYAYTRSEGVKYVAGKLHTFTIRIDRKADGGDYTLALTDETITPWEADKSSHDFESNSYLEVHVEEAGTLRECLEAMNTDVSSIRNLKITGQLTTVDFEFIREEMRQLSAINLKDTRMINTAYRDYSDLENNSGFKKINDALPDDAFAGMYSLRRVILPDSIKIIGGSCFYDLTLASTIIIPESVVEIGDHAFSSTRGDFTIVLPSRLEKIWDFAFCDTDANIELNLPNTLKYIGYWAFDRARNVYGTFSLPDGLTYLGECAFRYCGNDLDGEIVIPQGLKTIREGVFDGMDFRKPVKLTLHDGVRNIEKGAFCSLRFSAPVEFPKDLVEIGEQAFSECQFTGDLRLPAGLSTIGQGAFRNTDIRGSVELPESLEVMPGSTDGYGMANGIFSFSQISGLSISDKVEIIGEKTCFRCESLRYLMIGKNVSFIGENAFSDCPGLETIICLAETPPVVDGEAFRGIEMQHCVLEVPEASVELYRHADGWNQFRSITPHHELNVSDTDMSCLNKGITRSVIVRSEGPWEIAECPDWVKVSPMHADTKEEVTIKVSSLSRGSGNREGKVVFRLKESGYTTYVNIQQYDYEFEEDKEILIQKGRSNGSPVPVFIVGEGFGAESIVNGEYLRRVNEAVDHLFAIEPYKTYRDMFTVSASVTMSPDDGAPDILSSKQSRFGIPFPLADCPLFTDLIEGLRSYVIAVSAGITENNIGNALVIMVSNYNAFLGSSYQNADFSLACIGNSEEPFPYDNRGLVQYFAGGEAFGGLANEGISHFDFIKGCTCPACNAIGKYNTMRAKGLYENVTLSGKAEGAPWRDFMYHPQYSGMVDMYEGGLNHLRGVWRSEPESVMSNYMPYYNTISRYAIYKQIMKRAGLPYSFDEFIKNDKIEIPD